MHITITNVEEDRLIDVDFLNGDILVNLTFGKEDIQILQKILDHLKGNKKQ